jgi:hypothetical protein
MPKDIPADIGEYLRYEPDTGHLYWIKSPHPRIKVDSRAGTLNPNGYIHVTLNRVIYAAHRVAWFLYHGEQPPNPVDHKNQVRDDNRISNLRDGRGGVQDSNRGQYAKASSLPKWVYRNGNGFRARVGRNGKQYTVGNYETPEQAHEAALSHYV